MCIRDRTKAVYCKELNSLEKSHLPLYALYGSVNRMQGKRYFRAIFNLLYLVVPNNLLTHTHTHTHTGAPSLVSLKNTLFLRARGNSRRPLQAKDFPGILCLLFMSSPIPRKDRIRWIIIKTKYKTIIEYETEKVEQAGLQKATMQNDSCGGGYPPFG